jgi:hypothetical protein
MLKELQIKEKHQPNKFHHKIIEYNGTNYNRNVFYGISK